MLVRKSASKTKGLAAVSVGGEKGLQSSGGPGRQRFDDVAQVGVERGVCTARVAARIRNIRRWTFSRILGHPPLRALADRMGAARFRTLPERFVG
jgi:hypothetical protein